MQEAEDEKGRSVNPNIKGVWFEKEYQREYPYGSLASSVIGFTAAGNVGVNGLENYYNDTLNGINGREYGYLNTDMNMLRSIRSVICRSRIQMCGSAKGARRTWSCSSLFRKAKKRLSMAMV